MPQATKRIIGPLMPSPKSQGHHGSKKVVGRNNVGQLYNNATQHFHLPHASATPIPIAESFHAFNKAHFAQGYLNRLLVHPTNFGLYEANRNSISVREQYRYTQKNYRSTVGYLVPAPDPETLPSLEEIKEAHKKSIKSQEGSHNGADFKRNGRSTVSYIVPAPEPEALPSFEDLDNEYKKARTSGPQAYDQVDIQRKSRSVGLYTVPAAESEPLSSLEETNRGAIRPRKLQSKFHQPQVREAPISQLKGKEKYRSQEKYFYRYPRWMVSPPASAILPLDSTNLETP